TGAAVVFVDILADTFDIDPADLERAIAFAKGEGLRPRMVVAVDLFGLPADYAALAAIADAEKMTLVADAAQGFGGSLAGAKVGTLADYTTTSFFPAKPLGCYGDGGAILTDDGEKAALLASLRFHGKGRDKYDNVRLGLNSRLDTLQAAILIEKLAIFAEEIEARNRIAARYSAALADVATVPVIPESYGSAWAQYTLRTERRDAVAAACQAAGVPTAVYYPIPLHRQTGYRDIASAVRPMPVSETAAAEVISLPMHPYLGTADQDRVIAAVRSAIG
ncbi:MAG TPA: DegT/DnrJ/EryC1/StrS family aminotransferase, partial [Hyphomicrobiales bacterium]|nr:DegT/DnrJ/EryC1/StrS family aminotransferase [Hyphomicrobiales bacterium]